MHSLTLTELEARKARGAFFTPPEIASLLADWAVRSGSDYVLEPSCGEAAFLTAAADRLRNLGAGDTTNQLVGIDIHADAVDAARGLLTARGASARFSIGDFFDFKSSVRFDAVIGNPPYVRYQAFAGNARAKGREAALAQGVRLAGLASSWAAFTVHAASFLKDEGRLALVLPAELLSVNYAAPVRSFLMSRFARVRLILFEERVFPGVLEEVVLLLADGKGPTTHCELIQAQNLEGLNALNAPQIWEPRDSEEKWTAGLLPAAVGETYQEVLGAGTVETLGEWGDVTLGMVTGNNRYFCLNAADVQRLGLKKTELMPLCPPGSRHLRGLGFTTSAWEEMLAQGSAGYLFDPRNQPSDAAQRYIADGEKEGVHEAYKCRVRSPWWKVPRVPMPDAFFTYMNHDTPRIVTNRARVSYLNSVHGVLFNRERRHIAMDLLPIAALNSFTLLGSELVGRSYGGGMLKLEPREAARLPVPSYAIVEAAADDLRALRLQLAKDLRQGNLMNVVKKVDRVMRPHLKLKGDTLQRVREAHALLFNRRVARAKTNL